MSYNQHNLELWIDRAGMDYFTAFIRAWIPFNAWYKHVYPALKNERDILNEIKKDGNVIRAQIKPLLGGDDADAVAFKNHIGELHRRLDSHELEGRFGRIHFSNCYNGTNPTNADTKIYNSITYTVKRNRNTPKFEYTVRGTNRILFQWKQDSHDLMALQHEMGNCNLSPTQCSQLTFYHNQIAPDLFVDLFNTKNNRSVPTPTATRNNNTPSALNIIACGDYPFCDNPDLIFAGLIEILYGLRNQLFHGEIAPNDAAAIIYEPAYFILLRFLQCLKSAPH